LHLSEDKCPKCGWKAPAGLLKCPFCKTYIRKPGGSSSQLLVPDAATIARAAADGTGADESGEAPASDATPSTPLPLDPAARDVARQVQREIGRALFDDSDAFQTLEKKPPEQLAPDVKDTPPKP
jgi:hypothetical protein